MISDGSFEEFECASSDDKHFLKSPITLPVCGHSVCRQCLPQNDDSHILCKICGKNTKTNRSLKEDKEPVALTKAFRRNLENLFFVLEKQSILQLNKLSGNDQRIKLNNFILDF